MRQSVRTISESIVNTSHRRPRRRRLLGAGVAAMHWDAGGVDWHLASLVVLLGTVLAVNFLHLVGAYRFDGFARLESRGRPRAARLAVRLRHAVPGDAAVRAGDRRRRAVGRRLVLRRLRGDGHRPLRAVASHARVEPAGRLGERRGDRRRRPGRPAAAAQPRGASPQEPAHRRRLRRSGRTACRAPAWAIRSAAPSTTSSPTRASSTSTR